MRRWTDAKTQFALVRLIFEKTGMTVNQSTVSAWGRGRMPAPKFMVVLQEVLNISPKDWFRAPTSGVTVKRARTRRPPLDDRPEVRKTGTDG